MERFKILNKSYYEKENEQWIRKKLQNGSSHP